MLESDWRLARKLLAGDEKPSSEEILQACNQDAEAAARVRRIIDQHDRARLMEEHIFGSAEVPAFDDLWRKGAEIDGYLLEQEIGRGGSGVVFRATEIESAHTVAVKVFHADVVAGADWREADVLYALRDVPGIPRIRRAGRDQAGNRYLVTDFVEGVPLSVVLQQERALRPGRAFRYMADLAAALRRLHGDGAAGNNKLVHGDIKPSNIIIDADDRAVLIDFGIALLHDAGPQDRFAGGLFTETRMLGMTEPYRAPEMRLDHQADQRTDVFQLGLVGYEMLTGRAYWGLGSAKRTPMLRECCALRNDLLSPATLVPNIVGGMYLKRREIEKALRWDPENRSSARDLANVLGNPWKRGLPSRAARSQMFYMGTSIVVLIIALGFVIERNATLRREGDTERQRVAERDEAIVELEGQIERLRRPAPRGGMTDAVLQHGPVMDAVNAYWHEPSEEGFRRAQGALSSWLEENRSRFESLPNNDHRRSMLEEAERRAKELDGAVERLEVQLIEFSDRRRTRMLRGALLASLVVRRNDVLVAESVVFDSRSSGEEIGKWPMSPFDWRPHDVLKLSIRDEARKEEAERTLTVTWRDLGRSPSEPKEFRIDGGGYRMQVRIAPRPRAVE